MFSYFFNLLHRFGYPLYPVKGWGVLSLCFALLLWLCWPRLPWILTLPSLRLMVPPCGPPIHILPRGPTFEQKLTLQISCGLLFALNGANPTSPASRSHRDLPRVKFSAPGVRFQPAFGPKTFFRGHPRSICICVSQHVTPPVYF